MKTSQLEILELLRKYEREPNNVPHLELGSQGNRYPLPSETKNEDIKDLVDLKFIIPTKTYDRKTHTELTPEGREFIIKEMSKDWLIKVTEWFKLRNIIGYIITTVISLLALGISIYTLIKSTPK